MPQSPATPLPSPKERRRLREAKSLSHADLAAKIGVTRETVRSWETGRATPRGRKRETYAKLLTAHTNANATTTFEKAVTETGPTPPTSHAHPLRTKPTTGGKSTSRPQSATKRAAKPPTPVPLTPAAAHATSAAHATHATPAPNGHIRPLPVRVTRPQANSLQAINPPDQTTAQTPAQAFDALCAHCAPGLVRQTYLLTGRRGLAHESVERAFQLAWQRWPEVAVDRDPAGWVRAAAYEYAMSPWHRFRPSQRHPDAPPAQPADRTFLDVLLSLPPAQRRALMLYDGIGLDLPETAAETEASTPATANRLLHARETIAERLPDLADPEALHRRLAEVGGAEKLRLPKADRVRTGSEYRARFWTRAAIAFTALIIGATALTLRNAPTHYEPPQAPGRAISGVPPRMGPGPLTYEDTTLREKLRAELPNGQERLTPQAR
ncbi:helix-turn-helix domain-containing protein [Streptomyces sp. Je 1-369]|uniref:helix-turn-helix domain-containing protein n=1 Tax=Streptomyces sp. Je 1-369 TaxID=2966192 RepID=UPI0022861464|nr:helix-turn-helix domain-containing protein [Streptomyces sp. Je 1-369]WAL97408.1 helix-turn-helix domain-containing protein [Streptomyces sp. Je 1-369]